MHFDNVSVWISVIPQRRISIVPVLLHIILKELHRWPEDEVDVFNLKSETVAQDV